MRLTVLFMFAFTGALIVNAADLAVKVKLRWADVDFKHVDFNTPRTSFLALALRSRHRRGECTAHWTT